MKQFDPTVITHNVQPILSGLAYTVGTWTAGVLIGMAIGFMIAVLQLFGSRWLRALLRAYVEFFRGTPFLIQLFLLYYGGPSFGLTLEPMTAGVIGLGLYSSAYFAEAFRSGFRSVPKGHIEAAQCVARSAPADARADRARTHQSHHCAEQGNRRPVDRHRTRAHLRTDGDRLSDVRLYGNSARAVRLLPRVGRNDVTRRRMGRETSCPYLRLTGIPSHECHY
jgi:His/Glu/Gln/Arg/opine family amino acid ABC transporter permease subunit